VPYSTPIESFWLFLFGQLLQVVMKDFQSTVRFSAVNCIENTASFIETRALRNNRYFLELFPMLKRKYSQSSDDNPEILVYS